MTGGAPVATGGTASGGVATGGTATGGKATGGTATGGTATGGKATGGTATGGASTGGSGGLPTVPDNGCNVRLSDTPVGFAALDGGTVGGGNVTPILVKTAAELTTYLADSQPRVLYVMNDLDFRTANRTGVQTCADNTTCDNGSGVQIDEPRVSATCDSTEHTSTSYRYETTLKVASNKTVIGIGSGSGAVLRGASLNIGASQQVIFRNLRVYDVNPHPVEAGDGFTLQGSKHVWLDHLLLEQISDGLVDIGRADHTTVDDYVTLSWIHFNGLTAYQCGGKHHYVNAVDSSRVTYHHDWYDNCCGRNPKIGQATSQVHLFNNYWLNITYFCITAQTDAQARVESNYFENSSRPHWLQTDGNGTAGIAIDTGNVYTGASAGSTNRDVGGTVFSVPYSYTKESAADAKTAVAKCSGPQPIR
jgi:pectate lyase